MVYDNLAAGDIAPLFHGFQSSSLPRAVAMTSRTVLQHVRTSRQTARPAGPNPNPNPDPDPNPNPNPTDRFCVRALGEPVRAQ